MTDAKGYRLCDGKRMNSKLSTKKSTTDLANVLKRIADEKGQPDKVFHIVDRELQNINGCIISNFNNGKYTVELNLTSKTDPNIQSIKRFTTSDYKSILNKWINRKDVTGVYYSRGGPFDCTVKFND